VNDRTLIRICILGSAAGIISLYFSSFMIVAVDVSAGEIGQDLVGRRVKISGTVDNLIIHRNGHMFFDLADETGSAEVVIWEDRVEQLELSGTDLGQLKEGINITITGDVEYYRGRIHVVV
jgi:exonuclease VII large subunit